MEIAQVKSQIHCLLVDSFEGGQAEAFKCLPCLRGQANFDGAKRLADGQDVFHMLHYSARFARRQIFLLFFFYFFNSSRSTVVMESRFPFSPGVKKDSVAWARSIPAWTCATWGRSHCVIPDAFEAGQFLFGFPAFQQDHPVQEVFQFFFCSSHAAIYSKFFAASIFFFYFFLKIDQGINTGIISHVSWSLAWRISSHSPFLITRIDSFSTVANLPPSFTITPAPRVIPCLAEISFPLVE